MPTKKKTKKIKIMTVPTAKPKSPDAVETVLGALMSLQASTGWAIIVKILNENIAYLEQAILNKVDPTTQVPLSDAEVELLRTKRTLNIDLRDTPENYSKAVKDTGEVPTEYDPYYKSQKEIDEDEGE